MQYILNYSKEHVLSIFVGSFADVTSILHNHGSPWVKKNKFYKNKKMIRSLYPELGPNFPPHRSFVRKHICTNCQNREDVERFALAASRNRYNPVDVQTIFVAPNMLYDAPFSYEILVRLIFKLNFPQNTKYIQCV